MGEQDVGGGGRDDDLHVEHHRHDPRHGERHAARWRIVALAAGDPVVLTPQQPQAAPQVRADDGYIYPADGSSNEARYPAPRDRRLNGAQAYPQPQQQYYDNRGYAPAPQGYYYQPQPRPYQPRGLFTYQD